MAAGTQDRAAAEPRHFRFHARHVHLAPTFGEGWFGEASERFARFFGTPTFLVGQTLLVLLWIGAHAFGYVHFDIYPFILLNLAFSLQAAYAAPLILLAQTRQADRDKAHADADARHREDLARASIERQELATAELATLRQLLDQNTELTRVTEQLARRIDELTRRIHDRVVTP